MRSNEKLLNYECYLFPPLFSKHFQTEVTLSPEFPKPYTFPTDPHLPCHQRHGTWKGQAPAADQIQMLMFLRTTEWWHSMAIRGRDET